MSTSKNSYDFSWIDLELKIWKFRLHTGNMTDYEMVKNILLYKGIPQKYLFTNGYDRLIYKKQLFNYIKKFENL